MTAPRSTHLARVRLATEPERPVSSTTSVLIHHHRTPQVEWSIDSASGGHMLHLALAQCVLNNVLRLAREMGLEISDLSVTADGDFDTEGTASTGISCTIELSGSGSQSDLTRLAEAAFADSTVGAILRRAGPVELMSIRARHRPGRGSGPRDIAET